MNKPNIMITGCAGFIGSHTLDYFLEKGYKVTGVDVLTYAGKYENFEHNFENKNFSFHELDICELIKIKQICEDRDIDWIINFAAETHVDNSIKSSYEFIDSNIYGIQSLLEVCRELEIKLFHISTDEVYGDIVQGSFEEKDILNPKNPYSATKAAGEHFVCSYSNTYGVEYLMVRPSNNYGPRQHSEKFLPTIVKSLSEGKKIPVYGTGKNIREWTYVKDTAKAVEFILNNSEPNQIYNISSNIEKENIEIVSKVCEQFDRTIPDSIEFVEDRLGHDFRYSVNSDKLFSLGFEIESQFEDNLKETVEFFKGASS
tara:strand:- start:1772 stop:2716 length:945 start_codon:yes stop_codon:yes gene_type:complete